jgi:urea transport system substrate-binding protein
VYHKASSKVYGLRQRYYVAVALAALVGALVLGLVMPHLLGVSLDNSRGPIKVGVLHSLSGTMAVSERTVADATLYAVRTGMSLPPKPKT